MKKLLMLLVISQLGWSQNTGQNVVNLVISPTTTYTGGTRTITSAVLQNIGQTSHQVTLKFVGINNTASLPITLVSGNIQGSQNGTDWFNIGPTQSGSAPSTVGTTTIVNFSGYLPYPYIRVVVVFTIPSSNTSSLAINYVGSSAPSAIIVDSLAGPSNLSTIGAAVATSTGYALLNSGFTNAKLTLYGLAITAPSSATEFTLACSTNSTTADGNTVLVLDTNGANLNFTWPVGVRAYFQCPTIGDVLIYKFTGTGTFTVALSVRGE